MKNFLIFIGGMIAGGLLLYIIGFRSESSQNEKLKQQLIETLSDNLRKLNQEPEIQFIEIEGKKGKVTLHTGMLKDSVKMLLGKPDKVDLRSSENTTDEDWGYKIKNSYMSDLDINFEDGKLKSVRQN